MAKIALCIIKVHYQCGNGSFDHHAIVPSDSSLPDTPCIELAVINAEGRNVNLINFGVEQAAKESRWGSLTFNSLWRRFYIFFFSSFELFLSLNCQSKGFSYFGWIPVPPIRWASHLGIFFHKGKGLEVTENILLSRSLENLFKFGDTMYQNQTKFVILSR